MQAPFDVIVRPNVRFHLLLLFVCCQFRFLELDESLVDGVKRESMEEAHAVIDFSNLLGVYSIVVANQVQLVYLSTLLNENEVAPGEESSEVKLFTLSQLRDILSTEEIAFTTHLWALQKAIAHLQSTETDNHLVPEHRTKPVGFRD